MKNIFLLSLLLLVAVAWIALGAFSVYFEEYGTFKIIALMFLSGVSFLIIQNFNLLKGKQQFSNFKSRLFYSIKVVLVFFIFAILHFLNTHQHWNVDLTIQEIYKVRQASLDLAKSLTKDHDLQLTFWGTREQWNQVEELLVNFRNVSSRVKLQWIDPDKNPELAKTVEGHQLPVLNIEYKGQKKWIETIDEWVISVYLNSLKEKKNKTLCFLSTHETLSVMDESDSGLSELKKLAQGEGYTIQTMDLLDREKQQSCHSLIVIGAKDDFLLSELQLLNELNLKIPLIIALSISSDTEKSKNIKNWLAQYGLKTLGTPVLDQSVMQFGEEAINVLWESQHHQLPADWEHLKNVRGRVLWQLTTAFSIISPNTSKEKLHITPVIFSQPFPQSWQESSWKEVLSGKVTFDDKNDIKGPLPLMVEITSEKRQPMIVLGTDRLWSNGFRNYPANMNVFLMLMKKLLNDPQINTEEPILLREEKLYLHESQANLIFYLSIIVMPLLMLLLAFFIFKRNSVFKS